MGSVPRIKVSDRQSPLIDVTEDYMSTGAHLTPRLHLLLTTRNGKYKGLDEGQGRVRAHAYRRRQISLLSTPGLLLPGAGGRLLPAHLARAGSGARRRFPDGLFRNAAAASDSAKSLQIPQE